MTPRGLLRLALPSKGRLAEPATRLLSDAGIQFETTGRTLHAHAHDLDLDLLLARSDDIPVWTAAGDVDLGIAGQNQIVETGADVEPLLELGFGRCRLALAVPEGAAIASLADLDGCRVATSYPRTVAARLASAGVDAGVVTLGGSVELAPRLHAADAIVDLVSSGDTLRQNGLVELETLLESQAVLIARRDLSRQQRELTEELQLLIDSVLAARPKRYVMLNAQRRPPGRGARAAARPRRPDRAAAGARRHARRARRRRRRRRRPAARAAARGRRLLDPRPPDRAPDPMSSRICARASAPSSRAPAPTAGRRASPTARSTAST